MKQKMIKTVISIMTLGMLTSCSQHQNSLNKVDPETAALFLYNTAISAKTKLKFSGPNDGSLYAVCISGNSPSQAQCQQLYTEMVKIAHNNSAYKDLTVSDISDPKMWSQVSDIYKRHQFNTIV